MKKKGTNKIKTHKIHVAANVLVWLSNPQEARI